MKSRSHDERPVPPGIALLSLLLALSCGERSGCSPASTKAGGAPSAHSATTSAASATVASAASAEPSAARAPTTLTPKEFCAQAVQIGEDNLAGCAPSERANVPYLEYVKDLASAGKECSMRVESAKVEYHGEVARRCIEAARKRGGRTTFFTFDRVPACHGVLTGKAGEGQPVLFPEECAPGLAKRRNRCVKPGAKNARCDDAPGGLFGEPEAHPRCEAGLACFMTRYSADGYPAEYACLPPQGIGDRCKLDVNQCAPESSCYQGRCRAQVAAGGACMRPGDCLPGLYCKVAGGVFGTCVVNPPIVETCGSPPR